MDHAGFVRFLEKHAEIIEATTALSLAAGAFGYDPRRIAMIARLNDELARRCRELASEARLTAARDFDDLDDRRVCLAPVAALAIESAN